MAMALKLHLNYVSLTVAGRNSEKVSPTPYLLCKTTIELTLENFYKARLNTEP